MCSLFPPYENCLSQPGDLLFNPRYWCVSQQRKWRQLLRGHLLPCEGEVSGASSSMAEVLDLLGKDGPPLPVCRANILRGIPPCGPILYFRVPGFSTRSLTWTLSSTTLFHQALWLLTDINGMLTALCLFLSLCCASTWLSREVILILREWFPVGRAIAKLLSKEAG